MSKRNKKGERVVPSSISKALYLEDMQNLDTLLIRQLKERKIHPLKTDESYSIMLIRGRSFGKSIFMAQEEKLKKLFEEGKVPEFFVPNYTRDEEKENGTKLLRQHKGIDDLENTTFKSLKEAKYNIRIKFKK